MSRWITADDQQLPDDMVLTQSVCRGLYEITLHLDPTRPETALKSMPTVTTLRGQAGLVPDTYHDTMQWTSPNTLGLTMPLTGEQTALTTVAIPGTGKRTLSPVCLPYSPEFAPGTPGTSPPEVLANGSTSTSGKTSETKNFRGRGVLGELADATGGVERVQLANTWAALPKRPQQVAIAHWLLIAAIVFLLLEVLERRTGALSMIHRPALRRAAAAKAQDKPVTRQIKAPTVKAKQKQKPAKTAAPPSANEMVMLDALRQARSRADKRTRKNK